MTDNKIYSLEIIDLERKYLEIRPTGYIPIYSAVFSGGAGGARAPPEFGGSEKGRSLISAYPSLAITTNTPGFKKLNTALI
jgi:hypothetical protein